MTSRVNYIIKAIRSVYPKAILQISGISYYVEDGAGRQLSVLTTDPNRAWVNAHDFIFDHGGQNSNK